MCQFPRVTHHCGHVTLITHPKSTILCDKALLFVSRGLDRAPAFCTPLGPGGREDLYNQDMVSEVSEDYSWCPDCHAVRARPACGDQSDQSWETRELEAIKVSLKEKHEDVERACQFVEFNKKMPAIVETLRHPWLRSMLEINGDGYSSLGDAVLHRVHQVRRSVDKTLVNCNAGLPTNSLRIEFYAVVNQYDEAWHLMDHFFQLIGLLQHGLGMGDSDHNEICKQAEICKLLLQGPQTAPDHLAYLRSGFETPNNFKPKRDTGKPARDPAIIPARALEGLALNVLLISGSHYASALVNLLKQSDVLPLRHGRAFKTPSRYMNRKRGPLLTVKVTL
jgi:hypothetical protein